MYPVAVDFQWNACRLCVLHGHFFFPHTAHLLSQKMIGSMLTRPLQLARAQYYLAFGVIVLSWALGASVTIPIHRTNSTNILHPNGTLDYVNLGLHVRYVQNRYCMAQQRHHLCRRPFSTLDRRYRGEVSLEVSGLGGAPTIPIFVGGQVLSVVFDTVRHRRSRIGVMKLHSARFIYNRRLNCR